MIAFVQGVAFVAIGGLCQVVQGVWEILIGALRGEGAPASTSAT